MSLEGSRASMDAQSTVSTTACMPHHATETIAEEEQEEIVESKDEQGDEASWPAAATPATVAVGGEEGGEAGQNWNWAWLAGQLPPEHGTNDPSTLLDDESEGELSIPYVSDWWASCLCIQYVFHFCRSCDACQTKTYYRDHEGQSKQMLVSPCSAPKSSRIDCNSVAKALSWLLQDLLLILVSNTQL